jgi:hypothetical protein
MNRTRMSAMLGILAVAGVAFSQNARINSLGNVDIVDDISNIISMPAFMNDYPDAAQATAGAANNGLLIGVKAVGEVISLGTIVNGGSMIGNDFYTKGIAELAKNGVAAPALAGTGFPPIPHLLFGVKVGDGLKLGIDAFGEYRGSSSASDATAAGVTTTANHKARIYHIGANFNALVALGDLLLIPTFCIGQPGINGEFTVDNGTAKATNSASSEKGLSTKVGIEADLPLGGLTLKIGGLWSFARYQFATETAGTTTKGDEFTNQIFNGYAGVVGKVTDELLVAARYSFSYTIGGTYNVAAVGGTETTILNNSLAHRVGLGLERPISNFLIFDAIVPRAGVDAILGRNISHTKIIPGATPSDETITGSREPNSSSVTPTFGLGINKGRVAIDVFVTLGAWAGVVAGPGVVMGSVTIDMGKDAMSSVKADQRAIAPLAVAPRSPAPRTALSSKALK